MPIRRKNFDIYKKVIQLRKQEFSYTEINKETGIAKSTINNWLTCAGLTLTKEHFEIQALKRIVNYETGTAASKITRKRRQEYYIQESISNHKKYFNDPLFNYGLALYEAEGSKSTYCKFSNSNFKVIEAFVKFIENYFYLKRDQNMNFELYIHETRKTDLNKIKFFWIQKIKIPDLKLKIYWKKNKIINRIENSNYVGQMVVRVQGEKILGSKLLALSGIILLKYQR